MQYEQAEVSTSVLRNLPSNKQRKPRDRLSGRWDRSATRLPALEALCDDMFSPSKRLSLRLDFEPEIQTTPVYPVPQRESTSRGSREPPSPSSTWSPKSGRSKTSSGRRILRNIPTVGHGFWNLCMRSVPKIKFVKKFEETE